jgi:hypothetical protein
MTNYQMFQTLESILVHIFYGFGILIIEDLEFVCYLVLGTWNFNL